MIAGERKPFLDRAPPPPPSASKHSHMLDGLRGVAALAVVAYHFGGRTMLPFMEARGYLAVDFFFVLSGFVLAYAYGKRLHTTLTSAQFFTQRIIRLFPMLIPGTLFGAIIEIGRPGVGSAVSRLGEIAGVAVLGCLAIPWPFPTSLEYTIFPINGPVWSIFFELLSNVAFVIVARAAFPRVAALLPMLLGGTALAAIVIGFGSIDVGALITNWYGGLPRVLFSFFAGVLVFAYRHKFPSLPGWIFAPVLLALFSLPKGHDLMSGLLDLAIVIAVFPALVGAAANSRAPTRWLWLCVLSGEISYPLYAIHYPIVRAVSFLLGKYHVAVPGRLAAFAITVVVVLVAAWLALRFYDEPVRRYLSRRLRRPSPRLAPASAP